jgi:cell division protein FtsB
VAINRDPSAMGVAELRQQVEALQRQVKKLQAAGGGAASPDVAAATAARVAQLERDLRAQTEANEHLRQRCGPPAHA